MKAIRAHSFGGPEVLQLDDVDDPIANDNEVVVDIKSVGVNPADTYMRGGAYAIVPTLPYTPGGDAAGVISSVGKNVSDLNVGDRVFVGTGLGFSMTGCYAEKVVRPAADVARLPDNVSFTAGAALGVPYVTAHYGPVSYTHLRAHETLR